jgi:DNA-binding MarR family transcriptional regulator
MSDDPDRPVRRMVEQWEREMPGVDTAAMALFGRLTRAHTAAAKAIDEGLASHGLSRAEFDALATLRRAGAPHRLPAGALAASMLLSPAATTNRIDTLARAGLVARHPDPDDGRGVIVGLTPRGRRLVEAAVRTHADNERRLLAGLSPADEERLSELLAALAASISARSGAP